MKEIRVSDQPSLSFLRILRITTDGIRYRLFRASITVAVIAVAVAFLVNILAESLIKRSIALDTRDRMEETRLVFKWTAQLSAPSTAERILRDTADPENGTAALAAFARFGGLSETASGELLEWAQPAVGYLDFFNDLDYARRRRLVHQAEGSAVFDRLAQPEAFATFVASLEKTRSVRFPGTLEAFRSFLDQWPSLAGQIALVRKGQRSAIDELNAALEGRNLLETLADADGEFGEVIARSGFLMDADEATEVAHQVDLLLDSRTVEKSLEHRSARQMIARHNDILPGEVTLVMMWQFVGNTERAGQYLENLNPLMPESTRISAERLSELSRHFFEVNRLEKVFLLTADAGDGWLGLGQRMSWLLFVSMLVCAIGICNAMLMTVTERFREIATLKCLGALHTFIMVMFLLESCLMGVVGGLAGGLLGILLGSGRMVYAFGVSSLQSIPVMDLITSMLTALLVGILLAAIAAVYPALKAARLAPMEAMRVE
jgi:hypothetical protein